jgi:hypothetical protein
MLHWRHVFSGQGGVNVVREHLPPQSEGKRDDEQHEETHLCYQEQEDQGVVESHFDGWMSGSTVQLGVEAVVELVSGRSRINQGSRLQMNNEEGKDTQSIVRRRYLRLGRSRLTLSSERVKGGLLPWWRKHMELRHRLLHGSGLRPGSEGQQRHSVAGWAGALSGIHLFCG